MNHFIRGFQLFKLTDKVHNHVHVLTVPVIELNVQEANECVMHVAGELYTCDLLVVVRTLSK